MNRELPGTWVEEVREEFMADHAELSSLLLSSMHEEGDSASMNAWKEACQRAQEVLDELKQEIDRLFSVLEEGRRPGETEDVSYVEFDFSRLGSILQADLHLSGQLNELTDCLEDLRGVLQKTGDENASDALSMRQSSALLRVFLEKWCEWLDKSLDSAKEVQAALGVGFGNLLSQFCDDD